MTSTTSKPKEFLVIAGPNGAGKTAFAEEFLVERPFLYLSADRIAVELAPDDPTSQNVRAGREFLRRIVQHLGGSESVLVESTLSGRTFRSALEKAREAGFEITIVFVYLQSADACIARVAERVRKGGHAVPEADIRRRFPRSIANFWRNYRLIADHWVLVYNGDSQSRDVAVGAADAVVVRDASLFHQFLALMK